MKVENLEIACNSFNKYKIKPIHKAIMYSVNLGYSRTNEIKDIFSIFELDRLKEALSDLISYSILEIDDIYGELNLTKEMLIYCSNYEEIESIKTKSYKEIVSKLKKYEIYNAKALAYAIY